MTGLSDVTVIGLCGVTCSGKTSLTKLLFDYLKNLDKDFNHDKNKLNNDSEKQSKYSIDFDNFKEICIESILMDDYFLPVHDPRHVVVPELNHINWELMTSLDMDKMILDVTAAIERLKSSNVQHGVLIIDGFLVFNCAKLKSMCDLKFFVDLDFDTCLLRRSNRVYDPPDVPGYFEKVVWPESQKNKALVLNSTPDLHVLDGSVRLETNFKNMLDVIHKHWCQK